VIQLLMVMVAGIVWAGLWSLSSRLSPPMTATFDNVTVRERE
jgi:hypothetical protein